MKKGGLTGEFFSLYISSSHARHDRRGVSRG
jgi:hypothetical protein